eukprot:1950368-Lingulodinium_polyedra.AAC.1
MLSCVETGGGLLAKTKEFLRHQKLLMVPKYGHLAIEGRPSISCVATCCRRVRCERQLRFAMRAGVVVEEMPQK